MLLTQPIVVPKSKVPFFKENRLSLENHYGACTWLPLLSKSFWSSSLHLTWLVFYEGTELARNWSCQRFQKFYLFNFMNTFLYYPCLSSILEKANSIAIFWTGRPHSLGSANFQVSGPPVFLIKVGASL